MEGRIIHISLGMVKAQISRKKKKNLITWKVTAEAYAFWRKSL